jgi:hypothetical protein
VTPDPVRRSTPEEAPAPRQGPEGPPQAVPGPRPGASEARPQGPGGRGAAGRPLGAGSPWTLSRVLFGLACVYAQLTRAPSVADALRAGVSLASGPARVVDAPVLGAAGAWVLWGLGLLLAGLVVRGGRATKPALAGFLLAHAGMLLALGLDVRVPERVMLGGAVALLVGPSDDPRREGPAARWFLWLWLASLYGSTGLFKAIDEPAWWTGEAMRHHLVDRWHAGGALAAWVSGQPWATRGLGVFTIVAELALPVLLLFRRTSALAVGVGLAMHGGIALLMDVGPLGPLALALYPAAAHPEAARGWVRDALQAGNVNAPSAQDGGT